MFNKYRNIKKIGLVLIGLALVIFLITNVRIRSVDSYRKQFSNMADSGQIIMIDYRMKPSVQIIQMPQTTTGLTEQVMEQFQMTILHLNQWIIKQLHIIIPVQVVENQT